MIPAVLSRFEIEISCLQGVTGALRAQPLAVSLRPYEPLRYVGRRPRVAFFFCRPLEEEHCLCTNEIAYDGAATKLEKNCFGD
jgi:hypothetical protein